MRHLPDSNVHTLLPHTHTQMSHTLGGPDRSRHSRKFKLLSTFCPGFFVLPKANSRGVEFLVFHNVWIFVPPPERLPSLPGTEIRIFCHFCLLWPEVAQGFFEGTCAHRIRRGRSTHTPSRYPVLKRVTEHYHISSGGVGFFLDLASFLLFYGLPCFSPSKTLSFFLVVCSYPFQRT